VVSLSASCFRIANIMSWRRSEDAFSTCSSSANRNNSPGVLRFSSCRFMGVFLAISERGWSRIEKASAMPRKIRKVVGELGAGTAQTHP
jgi:hypothetical protein